MSEQQRYEHYCAWCRSQGYRPAEFITWRAVLNTIPDYFSVLVGLSR